MSHLSRVVSIVPVLPSVSRELLVRFAGPIELEVVGPDQYQRLTFYLWFLRGAPHFPTSAGTAGAPIKIIYS